MLVYAPRLYRWQAQVRNNCESNHLRVVALQCVSYCSTSPVSLTSSIHTHACLKIKYFLLVFGFFDRMSTRVMRTRTVHREVGYKYIEDDDEVSSLSSSYDSNDYDDDDDGLGRTEESSLEDYTDDDHDDTESLHEQEDDDKTVVVDAEPVRKLCFDLCDDELDFILGDGEPPLKRARKENTVIDLQ